VPHLGVKNSFSPTKKYYRFDTAAGKFIGGEINGVFASSKDNIGVIARATPLRVLGDGVIGVYGMVVKLVSSEIAPPAMASPAAQTWGCRESVDFSRGLWSQQAKCRCGGESDAFAASLAAVIPRARRSLRKNDQAELAYSGQCDRIGVVGKRWLSWRRFEGMWK